MKKSVIILLFSFIASIGFSQSPLVKVINQSDHYITVTFDFNKVCFDSDDRLDSGETGIFKNRGNHYYTISIHHYDHDKGRVIYYLKNSSIPYYAKDEDCFGTIIYVNNGMINIARDIKYIGNNETSSESWDVTLYFGCDTPQKISH